MPAPLKNRNAAGNRGGIGGSREGAGRTPDLLARVRTIRDLWRTYQHRFSPAEVEDIRAELAAALHDIASSMPSEDEWSGEAHLLDSPLPK